MAVQAQQCIVTCTNVLALYPSHLDALLFRGMARTQAGPLKVCARHAPAPQPSTAATFCTDKISQLLSLPQPQLFAQLLHGSD